MTEVFKKQIIKFVAKRDYTPMSIGDITSQLGTAKTQLDQFNRAFDELCEEGILVRAKGNVIKFPKMSSRVIGTFRANPKGFGFVIPLTPNAHGDLFVPPEDTKGAMSGDTVIARPSKRGYRQGQARYTGLIVEIVERSQQKIIGQLVKRPTAWTVEPDGKQALAPIIVDDVTAKAAKEGDKVLVEIIDFPTTTLPGRGVIIETIGKAGLYDTEIKSIIHLYDLPGEFSEKCIDQAREAARSFDATKLDNRDDITGETILTIDPPDAKDFDDAISLKKNPDGNWVLGIHIADVSTYIGIGSPLDVEAQHRGNSTYLPGKVIPMLPEILSNGICSLQPDQDRYAKSVYITYDVKGNILGTEFANSLIRSKARLTYLQADAILKGDAADQPGPIVALLKDMETLARAIESRRRKKGMLHLDLPDTELVLDDEGKVVDANPADDCYPHTIIEMFMVEANDAVASLMDRFNVPFIRRIHPNPDPERAKKLSSFVRICGFKLPRTLDKKTIQDLLASVKGTPLSYGINMHVLRSLQKAEYAPLHIGHYALASTTYAHFTSPIRRYADLTLHRLLNCYLEHKLNMIGLDEVLPEVTLGEIGSHITNTEQNSSAAENELKRVLLLQMLSTRIGEEMDCVVSGLTTFGIFVQCLKFGVEGLIEFGDLGMDEWKFDERTQSIFGKYSGEKVHMGQTMQVRIVAVDVPRRQLSLAPVELLVSSRAKFNTPKNRRKTKHSKRKPKKQSRRR